MIGRALRGPKFGGTEEANIVLFMDDWQQAIQFAEYSEFDGGLDEAKPTRQGRSPMQWISIHLVKQLLRSMGGTSEAPPASFLSLLPVGSYEAVFDLRVDESDDVESHRELVPVMSDEREGFEAMIDALCKEAPAELEEVDATLEAVQPTLERLCDRYLAQVARPRADLLPAVFAVARHVAQSGERPRFFELDERGAHDLDATARSFIDADLGPKAVRERLETEYAREDRYWRSLYPSFELFRQQYESRQAFLLDGSAGAAAQPQPATSAPRAREVSEEVKQQIRERDRVCLACGATKMLQVDHIEAAYKGGEHEPHNLQLLCKICNRLKNTSTMRFTAQATLRSGPKERLDLLELPGASEAADPEVWERYLRRGVNFFYGCAAVSTVRIAGRGEGYYNWAITLAQGNDTRWLEPHLGVLVEAIQGVREKGKKPPIQSLTITGPGSKPVVWRQRA